MSNLAIPSSRELLDSLVCGLPSCKRETWLFGMLNCYIDDSGSDPKSKHRGPVFVLAGYVSSVDRWKIFSDDWSVALRNGPKCLEYFKAAEAESLKEQFRGWNAPDRDAKTYELANIILNNAWFGVSSILVWSAYEAIQQQYPQHRMNPYIILFYSVIRTVVQRLKQAQSTEKVEFIFDIQGKDGDLARRSYIEAFDYLPQDTRDYVASPPIYRSEKDFIPLQSADMVSWQVRRCFYENESIGGDNTDKWSFRPLLKQLEAIPHITEVFDFDTFPPFFEHLKSRLPEGFEI